MRTLRLVGAMPKKKTDATKNKIISNGTYQRGCISGGHNIDSTELGRTYSKMIVEIWQMMDGYSFVESVRVLSMTSKSSSGFIGLTMYFNAPLE